MKGESSFPLVFSVQPIGTWHGPLEHASCIYWNALLFPQSALNASAGPQPQSTWPDAPITICWKYYFSIEQSWYPCQKPIYHKGKGLFLDSQLCCLIYTSIHLLVRHGLDYTSFVESFKMGSMSPPTLIYCSRFYWLLWVSCIFIWILGPACPFLQNAS